MEMMRFIPEHVYPTWYTRLVSAMMVLVLIVVLLGASVQAKITDEAEEDPPSTAEVPTIEIDHPGLTAGVSHEIGELMILHNESLPHGTTAGVSRAFMDIMRDLEKARNELPAPMKETSSATIMSTPNMSAGGEVVVHEVDLTSNGATDSIEEATEETETAAEAEETATVEENAVDETAEEAPPVLPDGIPEGSVEMGPFKITYYCCERYEHICGSGDGITASGTEIKPWRTIAVDPKIIPLGSLVYLDFHDGNGWTEYVAEDTGGLIKGCHIDVAVETHAGALRQKKLRADVYCLCPWDQ